MTAKLFEEMLTGGHHNSLGRTEEVVDLVLADQQKLESLYHCYFSDDEVVRLRTSSAMKRVCKAEPSWMVPYIDRLLTDISQIDQASTQWTLANLFQMLEKEMTAVQRSQAQGIMQHNLAHHTDWIVLNYSMQVLSEWAEKDDSLRAWLIPHLERLMRDGRKSVAKRANKLHTKLTA